MEKLQPTYHGVNLDDEEAAKPTKGKSQTDLRMTDDVDWDAGVLNPCLHPPTDKPHEDEPQISNPQAPNGAIPRTADVGNERETQKESSLEPERGLDPR